MIDMISKGRLVSGIVRGAGQETICVNSNPAYNRERFDEAHNLLVKTMTDDGPFSWEGEHYQYPGRQPVGAGRCKSRIRGSGCRACSAPRRSIWAAEHRYPYISLNTPLHLTGELWEIYDEAARQVGYEPGPENRGYLLRVHVQDTEEKAIAGAREFMWMQGQFTGVGHPYWVNPPGYGSESRRLIVRQDGQRAHPQDASALPSRSSRPPTRSWPARPTRCIAALRVRAWRPAGRPSCSSGATTARSTIRTRCAASSSWAARFSPPSARSATNSASTIRSSSTLPSASSSPHPTSSRPPREECRPTPPATSIRA